MKVTMNSVFYRLSDADRRTAARLIESEKTNADTAGNVAENTARMICRFSGLEFSKVITAKAETEFHGSGIDVAVTADAVVYGWHAGVKEMHIKVFMSDYRADGFSTKDIIRWTK